MNRCPDCGDTTVLHQLRLITAPNQPRVKYIPQIKTTCARCGRYLRFAKQEGFLVDFFNEVMESIRVEQDGKVLKRKVKPSQLEIQ